MNIFKAICNFFKKNSTKKKTEKKELTEAEIIAGSARMRAIERVMEKRSRFPRGYGSRAFYHSTFMDDFENEYDRAFTEVYSEYHGYSKF